MPSFMPRTLSLIINMALGVGVEMAVKLGKMLAQCSTRKRLLCNIKSLALCCACRTAACVLLVKRQSRLGGESG
eukprot:3372362-Amphidinium_carterae.2